MKTLTYLLLFTSFFIVTFAVQAQPGGRYGGSFARGVELFYAKDYAGSVREFEKAEVDSPANHAAYLWHGLATAAMEDADRAGTVWLKMPWDKDAVMIQRYLQGLAYWHDGRTNPAKYWFEETKNYKDTKGYKLSQEALKKLLAGDQAAPIESWPTLAGLPGARGTSSSAPTRAALDPEAPGNNIPQAAEASGARPGGGLWRGTISNGYTGQTLSFRVSADGKLISAIAFQGYLRCSRQTENTRLAPLENVAVSSGSFSKTELQSPQIRFDFNGTFTSASTAKGTYRIQSGTECDTYELKWTAERSGR